MPQLRNLASDAMFKLLREIKVVDGLNQSCISCENFDESKELCKKFNARPPARIIALSCDSYIDIHIPF